MTVEDETLHFSGRIYRLANSVSIPNLFREIFILGMSDDLEVEQEKIKRHFGGVPVQWTIDVQEFHDVPKLAPALLYSRSITTAAPADEFLTLYVEGVQFMPPGGTLRLPPGHEIVPMAARGDPQTRQREMDIVRRAMGFDDADPWYDVRQAYEFYGTRCFIKTPTGFDESVWFISAGFEQDPIPAVRSAADARARELGGTLLTIDTPFVADNLRWGVGTQLIVSRTYRTAAGGRDEFEARIVDLSWWIDRAS